MLTDAKCRSAKPRDKSYKLADGRGLYLEVLPSGYRSWRWKYRIDGREKRLTIGGYPEVSLADARAAREVAAKTLRDGADPSLSKSQAVTSNFEELARRWHARQKGLWSESHARNVLNSLEVEVFPTLGRRAVATIRAQEVLAVLERMVARGAVDQAHRLRQRLSDIFTVAIASGVASDNPAEMLRKALPPVIKRNYPALTTIEDARALLTADANLPGFPLVKLASRLLALTAVRSEALRHAEPSEFEELDGEQPIWRIPAAKMKLGVEQRKQASLQFIVPLAPQSVAIVKLASELTRGGPYLFPNLRWPHQPMSENALSVRYRAIPGFTGRHVPHGWRSTFSTVMNERAQEEGRAGDRAIIDLMLAHQPQGVEPIYNRAAYMPRRREIAQEWADHLDVDLPSLVSIVEGRRHR